MTDYQRRRYTPLQRALALLGVLALAALSAAAFFVAVFGGEEQTALVVRLLVAAVSVPIAIWLVLWGLGRTPNGSSDAASSGEAGNG